MSKKPKINTFPQHVAVDIRNEILTEISTRTSIPQNILKKRLTELYGGFWTCYVCFATTDSVVAVAENADSPYVLRPISELDEDLRDIIENTNAAIWQHGRVVLTDYFGDNRPRESYQLDKWQLSPGGLNLMLATHITLKPTTAEKNDD